MKSVSNFALVCKCEKEEEKTTAIKTGGKKMVTDWEEQKHVPGLQSPSRGVEN